MLQQRVGREASAHHGMESFRDIFEGTMRSIRSGDVVTGRVVGIDAAHVTVDIGYKSEGVVSLKEFVDASGNHDVSEGDEIDVYVESLSADGSDIRLSHSHARESSIWRRIEEAFTSGAGVEGRIVGRVKGGLKVDVGVSAFLPGSHVDLRPSRALERYVGESGTFAILKFNRARANVVVSRRVMLEKEREVLKGETLKVLGAGVILEGTVKNVTDYGAFVDLGGVDGLLHVTDMSWGRVGHPSKVVSPGDILKVVVLKFDASGPRISLGLKQLLPDPWTTVADRLFPDSRITGKIVSLTDYGAFVEVEPGVEGLVHVSEMSWTTRVTHPSKIVSVGDDVDVVVLAMDPANRRISLGLKQVTPNPWESLSERHPVGVHLEGKVTSITDFGAFVNVADGIDGLIHISDMHWTRNIKHPSDVLQKGQQVEAVVLQIDVSGERLSLGLKQVSDDPWTTMAERHPVGSKVRGKVTNVTDFGVFVEIEDGVEGMAHVSQLSNERVEDPRELFKRGQDLEAAVMHVDPKERKIGLSVRSILESQGEKEAEQYVEEAKDASRLSLADLINKELARGKTENGE